VTEPVSVRIDEQTWSSLRAHLFRGDGEEHGAVLAASVVATQRGTRLLVRRLFIARDGVEYVPGRRGYRMLTAEFVRDCAAWCAARGLAYLPVHNHGGTDRVGFSGDDNASHERGYPALVGLLNAPVCALVFASEAAAGDVWSPDGRRFQVDRVVVPAKRIRVLRSEPQPVDGLSESQTHHRQSLLLGPLGLAILRGAKVGVIGAGGVGSLLIEYLARLGVGHLVVVDPDRIDETNFSRLPGSTWRDCHPWLWGRRTPKVNIAERVFRRANRHGRFEKIFDDFRRPSVVGRFLDCDFLFLAADPMSVRLLFNQVVQQYLIPGIAIGAKAVSEKATGTLREAFSIVRTVVPGRGCLWCSGYISPERLAEEAATSDERRQRRYVDDPDVVSPSVITMNAVGAALASNFFLFGITDLGAPVDYDYIQVDALDGRIRRFDAPTTMHCPECSVDGRLGAGAMRPVTTIA
jgi:molybdopterin/thiamine biosynthesis adenylyltransferase